MRLRNTVYYTDKTEHSLLDFHMKLLTRWYATRGHRPVNVHLKLSEDCMRLKRLRPEFNGVSCGPEDWDSMTWDELEAIVKEAEAAYAATVRKQPGREQPRAGPQGELRSVLVSNLERAK